MLRFRDLRVLGEQQNEDQKGGIASRKGRKVLPDLPTAILARIRGYVGGSYQNPLTGEAANLGYHPLSSASPEEIQVIQDEMQRISGKSDGDDGWSEF